MAIKVVDMIVERREMILLIKRGDFWIIPGGELVEGESEQECLEKVVDREMHDKVAAIFRKLDQTVRGLSPVRGGEVEVSIYVGDISKEKMSDVKDCNAHWFSRKSIDTLRLSNITRDVLDVYFAASRG